MCPINVRQIILIMFKYHYDIVILSDNDWWNCYIRDAAKVGLRGGYPYRGRTEKKNHISYYKTA